MFTYFWGPVFPKSLEPVGFSIGRNTAWRHCSPTCPTKFGFEKFSEQFSTNIEGSKAFLLSEKQLDLLWTFMDYCEGYLNRIDAWIHGKLSTCFFCSSHWKFQWEAISCLDLELLWTLEVPGKMSPPPKKKKKKETGFVLSLGRCRLDLYRSSSTFQIYTMESPSAVCLAFAGSRSRVWNLDSLGSLTNRVLSDPSPGSLLLCPISFSTVSERNEDLADLIAWPGF